MNYEKDLKDFSEGKFTVMAMINRHGDRFLHDLKLMSEKVKNEQKYSQQLKETLIPRIHTLMKFVDACGEDSSRGNVAKKSLIEIHRIVSKTLSDFELL